MGRLMGISWTLMAFLPSFKRPPRRDCSGSDDADDDDLFPLVLLPRLFTREVMEEGDRDDIFLPWATASSTTIITTGTDPRRRDDEDREG